MVNVFLNNGHEFQEISIEAATSARIITDTSPEHNGAVMLVCLDRRGNEVSRFRWDVVCGYVVGPDETHRMGR